jgi:hypothetical protein
MGLYNHSIPSDHHIFVGFIESPDSQELAAEDRLIDSKTVEAEYAEQVTELTRHSPTGAIFWKKTWNRE